MAKPCSSGSSARPTARVRGSFASAAAVGDAAQFGDAVLAQDGGEPVGRAFAIGGDRRAAAGFLLGGEIVAHRVEQVDPGVGALGGEIFRRPRAGVERVAHAPTLSSPASGEGDEAASRPDVRLPPPLAGEGRGGGIREASSGIGNGDSCTVARPESAFANPPRRETSGPA